MKKNELRLKHNRFLTVLMIGFILTIMLFIWYKHFSFRSLKIYSLPSRIDNYNVNSLSVEGLELQYKETRRFVGQWLQSDYYVAEIANNSQSIVYIFYRTKNNEEYNKLLHAGECVSLPYSSSDIIDIYCDSDDVSDVSIEVNNYEYMNMLKLIVKWLLVFSLIFTIFLSLLTIRLDTYHLIKKVLSIAIGILVIIGFISSFLNLYPHIYTTCEYLTVFLGVMLILLGTFEEQNVKTVNTFEKLVCLSILAMGIIYLIFSQMLNSTKGWLTYFSAWNQKAVFDYVALNGLLLVIIIVGMAFFKNGFLSRVVHLISCKEFLYSIATIELVLFMPLTSWRADMSIINGIALIIIGILIIVLLKQNWNSNKTAINNKVWIKTGKILLEALILSITVINTVQINYWYSNWDIYHSNWYFNSVYDVANNLPYTGGYMELYGHFALFYKIPLLILGNSVFSLAIITAIFMIISLICLYIVAHKLINKYIYRLIFEICIFACFTHRGAYPMNFPHRLLFSSMIILFMLKSINKLDFKRKLLGYIICVLSVLWSTEVGIFCCAVYIAYIALLRYKKDDSIKSMVFSAIKNVLLIPISVLLSYCIVQLYNYVVLGRYSNSYTVKSFLGTLVDKEFMSSAQYNTFYFENAQWIYYWVFLLAFFIFGLYKIGLFESNHIKSDDNRGVVWCILSSIGLAFMVIILSRPEDYRLVICWILLMSLMVLDRMDLRVLTEKNPFIKNINLLLLIPIIVLIANCLILLPDAIHQIKANIVDYKRFDYEMIKKDELQLESYPIEEIYAVGDGMKLLYFDMGYKLENGNGGLAPEGPGEVDELMADINKKYIFTDLEVLNPNYKILDEIKISNKSYTMYKRID